MNIRLLRSTGAFAIGTLMFVNACTLSGTASVSASNSAHRVPVNSAELQETVATYAASGMRHEATAAFGEYLLLADNKNRLSCEYCVALLAAVDTANEDPLVEILFDAMDEILEDSYQRGSGEALIPIALMAASSGNRSSQKRAVYYMTSAVQFGITDEAKLMLVQFLAEVGYLDKARELAGIIIDDEHSVHYRSDNTLAWIEWLDSELARTETVGSVLVAAAAD